MEDKRASNMMAEESQASAPILYSYAFWDKGMQPHRKKILSILILPLCYTSLLMWICLSIYWGSLIDNSDVMRLKVIVVNNDGGSFGSEIVAGIEREKELGGNVLDWVFDDFISDTKGCQDMVLNEKAWAVFQVSSNTTASLQSALAAGIASYNPQNALNVFYASARNQITVNSHVLPSILAIITPLLEKINANTTAAFLRSGSSNQSAIDTALNCPQCLSSPFGMAQSDLVPFNVPVAMGSTMVGLIFLLTFTFSIFQILRATGLVIGAHLRLSSALILRTVFSLTSYLILALWYTLINLAFGVPMGRYFAEGKGFMAYWMLNTCTMGAVGLPMESLFTLIGLKWAGYFLSFWIIVNVSPAFTSFELMPSFYKYGYAFPFYHSIQGARTIIFGTKSHLGVNFGVLIAWMVIGLAGMYASTAWRVKHNKNKHGHDLP